MFSSALKAHYVLSYLLYAQVRIRFGIVITYLIINLTMSLQGVIRSQRVRLTTLVLSVCVSVSLLTACTTEKKQETAKTEKYPVVHPVVTDTLYARDYVADIQAVQNVEIRTRIERSTPLTLSASGRCTK